MAELQDVDRDAQGNIRVTEIDLGRKVKNEVQMRLGRHQGDDRGQDDRVRLRCAPPIPFDADARAISDMPPSSTFSRVDRALVTIQEASSRRSVCGCARSERREAGVVLWT